MCEALPPTLETKFYECCSIRLYFLGNWLEKYNLPSSIGNKPVIKCNCFLLFSLSLSLSSYIYTHRCEPLHSCIEQLCSNVRFDNKPASQRANKREIEEQVSKRVTSGRSVDRSVGVELPCSRPHKDSLLLQPQCRSLAEEI